MPEILDYATFVTFDPHSPKSFTQASHVGSEKHWQLSPSGGDVVLLPPQAETSQGPQVVETIINLHNNCALSRLNGRSFRFGWAVLRAASDLQASQQAAYPITINPPYTQVMADMVQYPPNCRAEAGSSTKTLLGTLHSHRLCRSGQQLGEQ